ncbi:hypothetical protein D7V86_21995 [bacterium D16-51]|nr:hypothetical protein D7V96_03830 [bacterium D16-59]RKI55357.1 hypothetical protein D7V86_21995 [bacterium D16-51]
MSNVRYAIYSRCIFPLLLRNKNQKKTVPDCGSGSFLCNRKLCCYIVAAGRNCRYRDSMSMKTIIFKKKNGDIE